MGTLYIVPTPIGNLEDMTLRALTVLKSVSLIAAEDTRHSRKLTEHFGIGARLTSYHDHNKATRTADLIAYLASSDLALITDAGTPCISDPGWEIVRAAVDAGYPVVTLPGANAITTALSASGLPTNAYRFYGFPPRKDGELRSFLKDIADQPETLIFYESPMRLIKTLATTQSVLGDRHAVVAVELTKYYESFTRGRLSEVIAHFGDQPIRGEVTFLLAGATS